MPKTYERTFSTPSLWTGAGIENLRKKTKVPGKPTIDPGRRRRKPPIIGKKKPNIGRKTRRRQMGTGATKRRHRG